MARSEPIATTPSPRALVILGGLLTLFALAIRLYRLDAQSLWLDEGSTWAEVSGRSGKGWLALLAELFSPSAGYPLYHLILKAWIAVAGDSEWALRFPSALAGALAAPALLLAATELQHSLRGQSSVRTWWRFPLAAGMLSALSPYALWHAQDAKVYSLLILCVALLFWTLLRALRTGAGRDWRLFLSVAFISVFVHRLALLALAGAILAVAVQYWRARTLARPPGGLNPMILAGGALALGAIGIAGTLLAARGERPGSAAAVGPFEGIWLTFTRFSLDRWPGDLDGYLGLPGWLWLVPFLLLTCWGFALVVRDARSGDYGAVLLLCLLIAPLGLFAIVHTLAPVYQARYAAPAFPAWIVLLAYPLLKAGTSENRATGEPSARGFSPRQSSLSARLAALLVVVGAIAGVATLLQPGKGLFSGAPVKEQWREGVTALARRVHPDDLVLLHPYYVAPLYDYYANRVTPDPLPQPAIFPIFAEGDTCGIAAPTPAEIQECSRRRYEPFFNQQAQGRKRALLLIAPDHARTVDPPPLPDDRFGWVGLRFQYPQRTWPCGGVELVGVMLMCQSYPETFNAGGAGAIPQPETPLDITFGAELRLRGVTLLPHGDAYRPGGTLPVTLYWAAAAAPTKDYRFFLHLCRDCDLPPPANDDGPPLSGYPPAGLTSTWRVGDPVHDERTLALPADLAPGTYTLLLGVYSGDGAPATRLPITGGAAETLAENRLVLARIEVK